MVEIKTTMTRIVLAAICMVGVCAAALEAGGDTGRRRGDSEVGASGGPRAAAKKGLIAGKGMP